MTLHKLSDPTLDRPVVWPDVYRREPTTGPDRLAIAPGADPLGLLCDLAEHIGPEHFLLYVHCVARSDHRPGRYQSPPLALVDVRIFVREFAELLEQDARHGFWIGSTENRGLLVYEEHGLVYAYGPLDDFVATLGERGIFEGDFAIPAPHMHHFHGELDGEVERLLEHWEWRHFDLQPEDER